MLCQHDITLVKTTLPLLENTGPALTEHFYQRLFRDNPELKHVFNLSHQHSGKQPVALFAALAAYARHLEQPALLKTAVERIANKHTSFNVRPEHYEVVGHHLLATLRELAPDQFTPDVEAAWTKAYQVLAGMFIDREALIYYENREAEGGWEGLRRFRLRQKQRESALVTSFIFEPVDQKPVKSFRPGQYLGIRLDIPGHPYQEIRQYSLSDKPDGRVYRISVKRETGDVPGIVSNYLHDELVPGDEVDLLAPAGDFFLRRADVPLVLISAGVGITPMIAMLESLTADHSESDAAPVSQDIIFVHACNNREQHSFRDAIRAAHERRSVKTYTWYQDEAGDGRNAFSGRIELSRIAPDLPVASGDFYLCGPVAFMQQARQQLDDLGVAAERIHYEVFGPHELL